MTSEQFVLTLLACAMCLWIGGVAGAFVMRAYQRRQQPASLVIIQRRVSHLESKLTAWQHWYKAHMIACGEQARMYATAETILDNADSLRLAPAIEVHKCVTVDSPLQLQPQD